MYNTDNMSIEKIPIKKEHSGSKNDPLKNKEILSVLKNRKKESLKNLDSKYLVENKIEIPSIEAESGHDSIEVEKVESAVENVEKKKTLAKVFKMMTTAATEVAKKAGKVVKMDGWPHKKNEKKKSSAKIVDMKGEVVKEEEMKEAESTVPPGWYIPILNETVAPDETESESKTESPEGLDDFDKEESFEDDYRFVYKGFKYGDEDERFAGERKYGKDFVAKSKKNAFSKWAEKKKDNKQRRKIIKEYKNNVKKLNDDYFKDLLGEKRIQELRRLSGDDKKIREWEMVDEILSDERDPIKRKKIERKMEIRNRIDRELSRKSEYIREGVDLRRKRRMYSREIEKEMRATKSEMEDLKKSKFRLPGDKEDYKDLKTKLEMLKKIEREKENKVSKFSKEQLARRKARLETPEMRAVFERYRKELKNDLLTAGKKTFTGVWAILSKPTLGLIEGARAGGFSGALNGFFEGLGDGFMKGGGDLLEATFRLVNALAVIPIKAGVRYAIAY